MHLREAEGVPQDLAEGAAADGAADRARGEVASSAASSKVRHASVTGLAGVTPGSMADVPGAMVTLAPKRGLPVNSRNTVAAAALNALWPDVYSAKGGVARYGRNRSAAIARVPWNGPPQASIVWPAKTCGTALAGRAES
jgi:hypothetical protein